MCPIVIYTIVQLCNRREDLKSIPTSDRVSTILYLDLNSGVLLIEITLGVHCNMDSDIFIFKVPKNKPFTRRGILSVPSTIYDPLAIVSPITLLAKKVLQDLCKQGLT